MTFNNLKSKLFSINVEFQKRGECGVIAREGHESHMSQKDELLAKAKQLKIFPLFKILAV